MDYKRFLKNVYLFKGADSDDLDALSEIVERKVYAAGDFVFHEGDSADALFIVDVGSVDLLAVGKEAVFTTIGGGQAFGELAFFERGKGPASASARERTEVFRVSYERLSKVLAARPGLALLFYRNGCAFFAKHFRALAVDLNRRYF